MSQVSVAAKIVSMGRLGIWNFDLCLYFCQILVSSHLLVVEKGPGFQGQLGGKRQLAVSVNAGDHTVTGQALVKVRTVCVAVQANVIILPISLHQFMTLSAEKLPYYCTILASLQQI